MRPEEIIRDLTDAELNEASGGAPASYTRFDFQNDIADVFVLLLHASMTAKYS